MAEVSASWTTHEKWLYDALLYGRPTADFIASVETAIKVLPGSDASPRQRLSENEED